MKKALLLNADWSPLNFVNERRAFNLVYKGRAEIVVFNDSPSTWDEYITTVSAKYPKPATIRLLTRVSRRWCPARFRKRIMFNRDNWTCQCCGKKLHYHNGTLDHVVPKSKGGKTTWKNCVSACRTCNDNKGNLSLADSGMTLLKTPAEPGPTHFWDSTTVNVFHPHWDIFVPNR